MFRIVTSMTQQRTFPENVRRATSDLRPCGSCGRPTYAPVCHRHTTGLYVPARPKAEDLPLILEWAREIRTQDAIDAYARTKVLA